MTAKYSGLVVLILSTTSFVVAQRAGQPQVPEAAKIAERTERARQRDEEFRRLRAFPGDKVPPGARAAAIKEMEGMMAREKPAPVDAATWKLIGP